MLYQSELHPQNETEPSRALGLDRHQPHWRVGLPGGTAREGGWLDTGRQEDHLALVDGEMRWFTDCGDPLT